MTLGHYILPAGFPKPKNNMNDLENKIAIVTGGTSGIGRATAIAFAKAGAKIIVSGRRQAEGLETIQKVEANGSQGIFVQGDITDDAHVQTLVQTAVDAYGRLDVAFNNAGVEWAGPLENADESAYRHVFDINVWGVLNSMRHQIPALLKNGSGSIINVSSVSSLRAGVAGSAYSASKAAVNQFTQCAAMEAAPYNVRLNVVAPGSTDTPGMQQATLKNQEVQDTIAGAIPMRRHGTAEEMAEAICFLGSDQASFITGVILPVDGGKTPQLYVPGFDITNLDNVEVEK